ncbi:hypothetical protein KIH77_07850 [Bifidobacterium sp. 82T24]|uniref:hypothetical protein n=1 Tax=Bifidobacterium pluvialisilvae TaxID=2834436 RepID=UPI001C5595E7|nr:hypothetical protein [Bifidobacterium pluvialisilvae]MBW3088639.1 hypothetical protein [Bifidobacterium pluvialisilvae]
MWTGTDQVRADAEKDAKNAELHMAWFYTKFALFCWVFAIGGLYFQLDEYGGRIAFDTILPVLLFGIPAAITTVVATVSFRRWHVLRHDNNPYDGLIGVYGKDIAYAVGNDPDESLEMPHYDQDNDPDHLEIRYVLFTPTADATVRFPVFIPIDLWRRCVKPQPTNRNEPGRTGLDKDISDRLDQMEAAGKISSSFRETLAATLDNESRHTAYIVLHVTHGQATIADIDPISTFEQRAEFDEKGAVKCVGSGRYDDDAKAIIVGRPVNDHDLLLASR